MLTIWFIGMYVIFIIQQITILYLVSRGGKNERKNNQLYRNIRSKSISK